MAKIVKRKDRLESLDLEKQVDMEISASIDLPTGSIVSKEAYGAGDEVRRILENATVEATLIREEARKILGRVKSEMVRAERQGFDQGRQEGLAEVTQIIVEAKSLKEKMFSDNEREIISLVYEIAEKILGREFKESETVLDLIRQALHTAIGQQVVLCVNPQDLEVVKNNHQPLMSLLEGSKTLQIRQDDKVAKNGCRIETEIGTVDAQLETQLAAIKKALGLNDGNPS